MENNGWKKAILTDVNGEVHKVELGACDEMRDTIGVVSPHSAFAMEIDVKAIKSVRNPGEK